VNINLRSINQVEFRKTSLQMSLLGLVVLEASLLGVGRAQPRRASRGTPGPSMPSDKGLQLEKKI
jgi:hypothetical protein